MAVKKFFIYFSKPLRLLLIYGVVGFLSSLFTLCYFFLYLKSVPIYVIVHVYTLYMHCIHACITCIYVHVHVEGNSSVCFFKHCLCWTYMYIGLMVLPSCCLIGCIHCLQYCGVRA